MAVDERRGGRAACPTFAAFLRRPLSPEPARLYRRRMSPFSESAFHDRDEGPTFLSRVLLSFVLLTAGIGFAVFIAAA